MKGEIVMVTKVSEITVDSLKNYLRLSDITEEDKKYLEEFYYENKGSCGKYR